MLQLNSRVAADVAAKKKRDAANMKQIQEDVAKRKAAQAATVEKSKKGAEFVPQKLLSRE